MDKESKFTMKRFPHGEAALPLLTLVLFAAVRCLAAGGCRPPHAAVACMVFVIVTLSGLFAFGATVGC